MTTVRVSYGERNPTHEVSLSDGVTTYGLIFAGGSRALQEVPLSPPAAEFANSQVNWIGGKGRLRFQDDETGYFDDYFLWSTHDQRLLPSLQWRFATGLRSGDTSLPGNTSSISWWSLYGNTPASKIARYLAISFVASSSYNADKGYLYIRRRGPPGTMHFELCSNNAGVPGTVLQTVTKTTSDITDTINVFQVFDWSGTQALVSTTTYHVKIYGASSDTSTDYWQVLCNNGGTSAYSANGSSWNTASVSMFYRVVDAATSRQWFFFQLEGAFYAVSKNDSGAASVIKMNGVRGTATSGTTSSLTDTNLAMTTNQYVGAYIRIYDGVGDGQIAVIASNTATAFTASFAIAPDATSRYLVYSTDVWNAITGTPGLGVVTGKPAIGNAIAY